MTLPASVAASLRIPLLFEPRRVDMEDVIERVVECFHRERVTWCLVGAHAVGYYCEPRATSDFDFIIDDQKWAYLEAALHKEFPDLVVQDIDVAVRLPSIHVDLIRASSGPLFMEALRDALPEGRWHIPSVEVMIVLKFLSATNMWRHRDRRSQDTLDLMRMWRKHGAGADRDKMVELSKLVYRGAEAEFQELLDKIDKGLPITI